MNIAGTSKALEGLNVTGSQATAEMPRQVAYGWDVFLFSAFVAVAPLAIASTEWDDATDVVTSVGHGYQTGVVVQVTTDGTLPTGITGATDYWVIALTDDTLSLAASLSDAEAGTAVDFTAAGSGNHTLTQQTDVATYQIQVSPDASTWVSFENTAAATIIGVPSIHKHFESAARYVRVLVSITKGAASTLDIWIQSKG